MYDYRDSTRRNGKVYKMVVRRALIFKDCGTYEKKLEIAKVNMLRFSLGVTTIDRLRNKYISETCTARLRWFGHLQRRDSEFIARRK